MNGKPGDHPLTDILVHGLPTSDDQVDELIKELDRVDYWGSELLAFLVLSFHGEVSRLRQHGAHQAAETALHNLPKELRDTK